MSDLPMNTVNAFVELTKPRITFLVVLSSLAGYWLGTGVLWPGILHVTVGVALLSGGIAALNQYMERDLDGKMNRTRMRPLPAGRLSPGAALAFGTAISIAAEVYLAVFLNTLTAIFGLVALMTYLFVYTPLKTRTTWCTFIGAFPGALPPLLGWTAARNEVGVEALILFGILFLWQFPHFHAIARLYREDYGRAGIQMLPVVETDGRETARQIVFYTLLLVPVSILPAILHMTGKVYLVGALVLSLAFLYVGVSSSRVLSKSSARRLLKASVVYLPLLLALMMLDA
jgi:protoheme IX farnesyltransferase